MEFPTSKKVLVFITLGIYIIHLIANGLAGKGGNKLFPKTVSEVSKKFHLEVTPVGATFSIWGAIFSYQLAWLIYATTTVCRSSLPSANILSTKFYIAFNLNILTVIAWLFFWSREMAVGSFIAIALGQVFINAAIAFACCDLKQFQDDQKILGKSKADVWCQRILVQNGILFYATWTTIATLINTAVVLSYSIGVSTLVASLVSLSVLGGLAITWFTLENFVFQKYTEYTFTAYITLIIGNSGIFAANNKDGGNKVVRGLSLALAILSVVFLVVRIIIIVLRAIKARRKENGYLINIDERKHTSP